MWIAAILLGLVCSPAQCYRLTTPRMMGLFDGAKEAFGSQEKPLVAADRVTPFDRWLGLDKELVAAEAPKQGSAFTYVDPSNVANYLTAELTKPMGIAFVENDSPCGGIYVDSLLSEVKCPITRGVGSPTGRST